MTIQCCKCRSYKVKGIWRSQEVEIKGQETSHTYCPDCLDETIEEIHQYHASNGIASRTEPAATSRAPIAEPFYSI